MREPIDPIVEAKRILDDREGYYFAELPEAEQAHIISLYVPGSDWHDGVLEELTQMLTDIGVRDAQIGYSGFSSQGDGAHFVGSYSYTRGAVARYKRDWPQDKALHALLARLTCIQRRYFYRLTATITHRGHYQHGDYTFIECSNPDAEVALSDVLRDLMCYIYKQLEAEYEYLCGEGAWDLHRGDGDTLYPYDPDPDA
jgi:hypothetical protein